MTLSSGTLGVGAALIGAALVTHAVLSVLKLYAPEGLYRYPSPTGSAVLGHVHIVKDIKRFHKVIRDYVEELGLYVRLRFLYQIILVVADPAECSTLLTGEATTLKADSYEAFNQITLGPSFFYGVSEEHMRRVRRAIMPAFSQASLRRYYPAVLEQVLQAGRTLAAHAGSGADADLERPMVLLAGGAMLRGLFGVERSDIWELSRHVEARMDSSVRWRGVVAAWLRLPPPQPVGADGEAVAWLRGLYAQLRDAVMTREYDPDDTTLAASLARLWREGDETDVQARLEAELHDAGLHERLPTLEELARLRYMSAVVSELLRLVPAAPAGPFRQVKSATRVGPHVIPPGVVVNVNIWALHTTCRNWEDPWAFQPERWLEADAAVTAEGKRRFMPFSVGPRDCAGQAFALLEMRLALAVLVPRLRFSLPPDGTGGATGAAVFLDACQNSQWTLTLKPAGAVRLRVERRDGSTSF